MGGSSLGHSMEPADGEYWPLGGLPFSCPRDPASRNGTTWRPAEDLRPGLSEARRPYTRKAHRKKQADKAMALIKMGGSGYKLCYLLRIVCSRRTGSRKGKQVQLLKCGCSSEVERQLPKLNVVGSIPIARSTFHGRMAEQGSSRRKMLRADRRDALVTRPGRGPCRMSRMPDRQGRPARPPAQPRHRAPA